jgi:hypothetical protein
MLLTFKILENKLRFCVGRPSIFILHAINRYVKCNAKKHKKYMSDCFDSNAMFEFNM